MDGARWWQATLVATAALLGRRAREPVLVPATVCECACEVSTRTRLLDFLLGVIFGVTIAGAALFIWLERRRLSLYILRYLCGRVARRDLADFGWRSA